MTKKIAWAVGALALAGVGGAYVTQTGGSPASGLPVVEVWKSPACGCCHGWIQHMESAGFRVKVHDVDDVLTPARENGVGPDLTACHTALVDGYVVEGHVPAADVKRLLAERPAITGVAVPGMPVGSPGMESPGRLPDPYTVVAFTRDGEREVWARH